MDENSVDCRNNIFLLSEYVPVIAEYSLPNLKLLDEYLQLEKRSSFTGYCRDYLCALSQSAKLNYTVLVSFQVDIIQPDCLKRKGISLVNYIIQKCIETAKDLLINTNLSVNLISDKVGYGNYSYFTTLFKKETGYTPVNYRLAKRLS